jgi:vacuolar protein sorting-associated protein 13A/C
LKKGALDKFQLPVDVLEGVSIETHVLFLSLKPHSGHLGKFELSLHWMNLGNQPVEILIEDVYLLVVPSANNSDPEEDEQRMQAAKKERLENAELLHVRGQAEAQGELRGEATLEALTLFVIVM